MGIDRRTIQPLAIRYTDYAIPAAVFKGMSGKTRRFQLLAYFILYGWKYITAFVFKFQVLLKKMDFHEIRN
jgi:hypothetical protein